MPFPKKDPLPWNPIPLMEDYLLELSVRETSKNYQRMVKVGLSHFSTFLRTKDILVPDEIERTHLIHFMAYLGDMRKPDGEPYAPAYRSKLMLYVRGWFTWLEETGAIEKSPWVRIKVPKVAKKPKPLEPEDVEALFLGHKRQAFQLDPFDYHQREVILTLLYSWGLRVHELCSLNLSQVDMRLSSVRVRNKGGGYKDMPYGDVEKMVVTRWLRHRARYARIEEEALLITRSGNRISQQRVGETLSALGNRVGVEVNPHRFRDTLGTTMLDNDVPVEIVMKILGHSQREQTLAYSRINNPVVERQHKRVMQDGLRSLLSFKADDGGER